MRRLFTTFLAFAAVSGFAQTADKSKGVEVELGGMKSTTPAEWKEEKPSNKMRMAQFRLPKVEKDAEDAELALFTFPGGSGTIEQNLDRQVNKFVEDGRKETKDKIKVGSIEATYQDVTGTYKKKKTPMDKDFTPKENFRQLYVVFETKDEKQYYMTLVGPKDTVEKHKKDFEEWLKNFK